MRNIKLVLAYDGTNFFGWQRQKVSPTIQGLLEEKISVMTGEKAVVHGAGRTDAGVHALGMVANFQTASTIPCNGFKKGLNSLLPEDVRVLDVAEAPVDFHARRNAAGKTYCYNFITGEVVLPTKRLYALHCRGRLDLKAMRGCLQYIVGPHDFTSFEASGSRDVSQKAGRGAVRRIFSADIKQVGNDATMFCVEIAGDGFLRHMVRNIIGTVIEVGQGKRSVAEFEAVLAARDRSAAGPTAPAKGLFLKEVYYSSEHRKVERI